MRRRPVTLVLALTATAALSAPTALAASGPVTHSAYPDTAPAPAGALAGRAAIDRADLQKRLDALTAARGQDGRTAVAAVADLTTPLGRFYSASGVNNLASGQRARPKDRTRIASITKPMVATLAMQEVAAGRWTLDTTVDDVLPGAAGSHGSVTLRQMLSHTSGMPDFLTVFLNQATTYDKFFELLTVHRSPSELLAAMRTLPWSFEPGTKYAYSNSNYVMVGQMLEKATGKSVGELLKRRIFKPARMHDTTFPTDARLERRQLTEYALLPDPVPFGFDASNFGAAGAVVSTADDVNAFFTALLGGKLLPKSLVAQMATPTPQSGNGLYGLGLYLTPDACTSADGSPAFLVGHDGASFGTFSLSFHSLDAKRNATISWTGRPYTTLNWPHAEFIDIIRAAFTPSCATPAKASSKSSGSAAAARTAPARFADAEALRALLKK